MTGLLHLRGHFRLHGRSLPRRRNGSPVSFLLLHLVSWTRFVPLSCGSALRPLIDRATMASADFCAGLRWSVDHRSRRRHPCRSPRVLRTCFPAYACRIYAPACWTDFGLRLGWHPYPACAPRMRFLFVRPAFCLGLPSHDASRPRSCLQLDLPSAGRSLDSHVYYLCSPFSRYALPGAPTRVPLRATAQQNPPSSALLRRQ